MTNQQGQIIFFSVLCIWSGFRSPHLVLFALCMLEIQQISKSNKKWELYPSAMIFEWKYADLLCVAYLLTVSGEWKNMSVPQLVFSLLSGVK